MCMRFDRIWAKTAHATSNKISPIKRKAKKCEENELFLRYLTARIEKINIRLILWFVKNVIRRAKIFFLPAFLPVYENLYIVIFLECVVVIIDKNERKRKTITNDILWFCNQRIYLLSARPTFLNLNLNLNSLTRLQQSTSAKCRWHSLLIAIANSDRPFFPYNRKILRSFKRVWNGRFGHYSIEFRSSVSFFFSLFFLRYTIQLFY